VIDDKNFNPLNAKHFRVVRVLYIPLVPRTRVVVLYDLGSLATKENWFSGNIQSFKQHKAL
jgi:hypothetical protein